MNHDECRSMIDRTAVLLFLELFTLMSSFHLMLQRRDWQIQDRK